MMHGLRFCGVIVLCSLAGAAAYYITPTPRSEQPSDPVFLSIPLDKLNLGIAWENESLPWMVPLVNESQSPIEIQAITGSCSCVTISPTQATLSPGETLPIRLTINHTTGKRKDTEFTLGLTVSFKHPTTQRTARASWELTGHVRRHLLTGRNFVLAKQSELTRPLQPWRMPVTSEVPLSELQVRCDIAELTPTIEAKDTTGTRYELVLTPRPQLSAREIQGKVTLEPTSRTEGALPVRTLRIEGEIVPDARFDPIEVLSVARPLGQVHEETVTISSYTDREWQVEKATPTGAGLTVETVAKNRLRIRQMIQQTGHQQNRVEVVVTSGEHRHTLSIPVIYNGIPTNP